MPLGATSKFGVIYFMVLIGFSQLLYLSTNKQNTGMATFIQAVERGLTSGFECLALVHGIVDLALSVSG